MYKTSNSFSTAIAPVAGETYLVTWDGETYEEAATADGDSIVLAVTNPDTGDDIFSFVFTSDGNHYNVDVWTASEAATHSFKIEKLTEAGMALSMLPHIYVDNMRLSIVEALNMIAQAAGVGITFSEEAPQTFIVPGGREDTPAIVTVK